MKPSKPSPVGTLVWRECKEIKSYRNMSLQDILDSVFPNVPLAYIYPSIMSGDYRGVVVSFNRYSPRTEEEFNKEMKKYKEELAAWVRKEKADINKRQKELHDELMEIEDLLYQEVGEEDF